MASQEEKFVDHVAVQLQNATRSELTLETIRTLLEKTISDLPNIKLKAQLLNNLDEHANNLTKRFLSRQPLLFDSFFLLFHSASITN